METHQILNGKVQIYRRGDSQIWQCSASVGGKQRRASTKRESLAIASEFAEDWYRGLRGKGRAGILLSERSFALAAEQFLKEYEIITEGERRKRWTEGHEIRLPVHLLPFFGALGVSKVSAGKVQDYRIHRMTSRLEPNPNSRSNRRLVKKPPPRSTLDNEIVTLRQVLKIAIRQGWLGHLPDLSAPYRTQGKIVHRPWFSPAEYKQLYQATRAYAREPFTSATGGMLNRSTTMSCSSPTRAFGLMRRKTCKTAMSRSSRKTRPARRSLKSRCEVNAALATANPCRAQLGHTNACWTGQSRHRRTAAVSASVAAGKVCRSLKMICRRPNTLI